MMQILLTDFDLIKTWIEAGFIVFLRVGTAMALLPAFGENNIPVRVRLMLGFAFTLVVMPAIINTLPTDLSPIDYVSEIIIGLALGLFLRLFVIALHVAGAIAAQATSLGQLLGTPNVAPSPAVGQLFLVAGLALATLAGLHVRITQYLILTYATFPIGRALDPQTLTHIGVQQIAHIFTLGFILAAPFVGISILYNFTLGFINRAMPQLMVAFVGAPAITLGALILLLISTPTLLSIWLSHLHDFLISPRGGL